MRDKEAISVLSKLLDKRLLSAEEREAVAAAIGIFNWTSLAESKIKTQKIKREKTVRWEGV